VHTLKKFYKKHPKLDVVLLVIGIIAVVSILGALFFPVGNEPKRLYTSAPSPSVDSPDFLVALSHAVNAPVETGTSPEILENGDAFFPSLQDAIGHAQKTINFSAYIWQDGEVSNGIIDALIQKQREGVAVRVLLDGIGSKSAPDKKFKELKDAGGKVVTFRPPHLGKLTRFIRRNHRRAIVIDGSVGYVGGMAVSDSWMGHAQDPKHWRDTMFKVEGTMAQSLQSGFADLWAGTTGEILSGPDMYPPTPTSSSAKNAHYIPLVNSPASDVHPVDTFVVLSLLGARKNIFITTPYFMPSAALEGTLKERAHAGLDVRLLLPGKNIDNKTSRWGAQNFYTDLLKAGVRIYEYDPTFIHKKSITVDGQWSVIGSPNLNARSRRLDEENAFGISDPTLGSKLEESFMKDLEHAHEITLPEWQKRGPFTRVLDLFSRLLAAQS